MNRVTGIMSRPIDLTKNGDVIGDLMEECTDKSTPKKKSKRKIEKSFPNETKQTKKTKHTKRREKTKLLDLNKEKLCITIEHLREENLDGVENETTDVMGAAQLSPKQLVGYEPF